MKEKIKISDLCKADAIGRPQFTARFQPPPPWLKERIHKALAESAQPVTPAQFQKKMKAIADRAAIL